MPEDSAKQILTRIRKYFRENWGAPFIIGFIILLMGTVSFLAIGLGFLVNEIVTYAYYALVVGVVLQLICFLKYGERSDKKH